MPAVRRKSNKRSSPIERAWTPPSEPSTFEFAATLTPVTFNNADVPPPLVDAPPLFECISFSPSPSDASSPSDAGTSRRTSGHSKKKSANHIPRPPNAFILFRSSFIKSQCVSTEVETNHSTLSKIIGMTWTNLPAAEREVWYAKAREALEEHKRRFPDYAFRPRHLGKGEKEKRKVREVGVKDVKRCEKIAQLIGEGKKGVELEVAIGEFDKTHVKEVVMRFEKPITEKAYRRVKREVEPQFVEEIPSPSSSLFVADLVEDQQQPFFSPQEFLPVDLFLPPQQPSLSINTSFDWTRSSTPMSAMDSPECWTPQTPVDYYPTSTSFPPLEFGAQYQDTSCLGNYFFSEPQVVNSSHSSEPQLVDPYASEPHVVNPYSYDAQQFSSFRGFEGDYQATFAESKLPDIDFSAFMGSYST